jgi:hypothetical protein
MTWYTRKADPGELVWHSGAADDPDLTAMKFVPEDAVVVELPEVVLDFRSSTLKQARWVDTTANKAVTFSEHDDLDAREQNLLRRLAAIRAERVRREQVATEAYRRRVARETLESARRICQRGPRVPSLAQIEFIESLLRAGVIEEKAQ